MFEIFGSLKSIVKINEVIIDNNVFRLHYKFTTLILVAFSILVTLRQYFGDPIDCIPNDDVPDDMLDSYCWVHSTFTLPDAWDKKVGVEVPHPGIDKYTPGENRMYYNYYQWVCFVLFLQAILFYTPRYLWKWWERKKIEKVLLDLNLPITRFRKGKICKLARYLKATRKTHQSYASCFMFCELLNFVNVIGQIFLIDAFLDGEFSRYGIDVVRFAMMDQENRTDPMIKVFPRMTKCTFHRFGSSGDIQRYDALCILPLNIINEKIYIFLWFWFIILAFLSAFVLVFRCFIIFWPATRYLSLKARSNFVEKKDLRSILSRLKLGDWFVLYLLSKNMEPVNFSKVVSMLAGMLKKDESSDEEQDSSEEEEDKSA